MTTYEKCWLFLISVMVIILYIVLLLKGIM